MSWRKSQPVTILELQCSQLAKELTMNNSPDIWGCFSFADLPKAERDMEDMNPVLSQEVFWERQKGIRAELCRSEVHAVLS